MQKKIAIIGGGLTGINTAKLLAEQELAELVIIDLPEKTRQLQGHALDIMQAAALNNKQAHITVSANYKTITGATIVIITAGVARSKKMSREDVLKTNASLLKTIAPELLSYAPEATLIVLTNPVDIMTYAIYKYTGWPKERLLGQAGILDTARFKHKIASILKCSPAAVQGLVIGCHNDLMLPLVSHTTVQGKPLTELLTPEELKQVVLATKQGGKHLIDLLETSSAYYAPAAALTLMAEIVIKNLPHTIPASVYLTGEYGLSDLCLGVPVQLGAAGIKKIIELNLTTAEQQALSLSAAKVHKLLTTLP
ncbi:MAG: malate dehydrogenase [Bacillota bacterium]